MTSQPGATVIPYPTLPELRAEHARLLEARRTQGDSPEFLNSVAEFVRRGAATGAYIDNEEDRRGAQSLLDFWANVLYRVNGFSGAKVETPDPTLAEFDFALAPELPDQPCPYRGLEAFREANSAFFFGREQLVDELVERLSHDRLLALVGSSGSGKSSIVFGGLLPKLKSGIGADWRYLNLVPGAEPLVNLARLMPSLVGDKKVDDLDPTGTFSLATKSKIVFAEDGFKRDSNYLTDLANETGKQPVVLVVDQFEETFTLCTDDEARKAFVSQLIGLVQTPDMRHIVILTMRSDFVDSVAKLPQFKPMFDAAQVDVRAMGIDELRAAIEKPAEKVGLKFDEGVVSNLIETILGEQAGLPLLQFTLLKLWEERQRNRITKEVYKQVGDPRQALSRSAEAFYESLIFQNQTTAKLILMRMVRPALEGGREFTSNRIPLADVFNMGEPKDRVEEVLRRLIFEERLVKLSGVGSNAPNGQNGQATNDMSLADPFDFAQEATQTGPNGEIPQIEVAHEALVRNWPRLVTWLDEARVDLRKRFALTQTARDWRDSGHDANLLLRGRPLEEAEAYRDLNETEQEFVQASRAAIQAEERAKEEARQRELEGTRALAEAQRLRAEQQERSNQRLRQLLAGLVVLALVAVALAAFAFLQQQAAAAAQQSAEAAEANAQAQQATAVIAATMAGQEELRAKSAERDAQAARDDAEANLEKAQAAATTTFHAKQTADASALMAMEEEERAKTALRQAASSKLAADAILSLNNSVLNSLRTAIAAITTTTSMGEAPPQTAVDALRRVLEQPLPRERFSGHEGTIISARFSHDGKSVATAGADGVVRVWDRASGEQRAELKGHASLVNSVQFSPDDQLIVTASDDGTARLWDLVSSREITQLKDTGAAINSAAFSPDGRLVVTAGTDQIARIWNVHNGQVITRLQGHTAAINTAAFSPVAALVVTASDDGTARIWDVNSGREVGAPLGEVDGTRIKTAQFSPNGTRIVTGSEDGVGRLWDASTTLSAGSDTRQLIDELRGHELAIRNVEFSPDGARIITASDDTTARVWDAETRKAIQVLREHRDTVFGAQFSPDGQNALTTSADGTALVWSLQPGTIAATLQDHADPLSSALFTIGGAIVNSALFSPDGKRIVTASDDRTARVWDAADGRQLAVFVNQIGPGNPSAVVNEAQFSPNGERIVLASFDNAAVIASLQDTTTLVLSGHLGPVLSAAFSPDGKRVATASEDRTARIWDSGTGKEISPTLIGHEDVVNSVAFSPDGKLIATASKDGTAWIWDATTGERKSVLSGHFGIVWSAAFSPDGAQLVTASEDGTIKLWNVLTGAEKLTLIGHEAGVNGAAFSPDGQTIVSAGSDRTVRLWDAKTGNLLSTLPVHTDRVLSAAFSPDGKFILSASADGMAKMQLWRLDDLLLLADELVKE